MSKKKQIIFSSLLGIVLLVVIFMPKKETTEPLDEIEVTDSLEVKEITYKYGIPIDDYDVDYGIVKMESKSFYDIAETWLIGGRSVSAGRKIQRCLRCT